MNPKLSTDQLDSIKRSYLNILGLFITDDKIESRFLRCLLKWGFQLHLNADDLRDAKIDVTDLQFSKPEDKVDKLEAIYHLIYMIYLDDVVEDVELEVATIYAQTLGFKPEVVADLFKSIATAAYDQSKPRDVRQEVIDFLKVAQ
jgi:hypothetical protein